MRILCLSTLTILVSIGLSTSCVRCAEKLSAHEWGTFTSLQNENGVAIGGINTDDEPVPDFVHDIAKMLLITPTEFPPSFFQGAPKCHPDVTMRLETPVLYFHATGKDIGGRVDVHIELKGGWLTQFYPNAVAVAPNVEEDHFGKLDPTKTGSLTWRNLELNATAATGPDTQAAVWTAPRAVDALPVKTEKGEAEKYLFYRGVGHLDAPLSVKRQADGTLQIASQDELAARGIRQVWYADIRKDGTGAYRTIRVSDNATILAETTAAFVASDYKPDAIPALRRDMRAALIAAGLNPEESDALLNTWELSYFKSSGARLFFLVPPEWTARVMPLTISGQSCDITRVMVGRIELVSPEQRALLAKIAAGPVPSSWADFRQPLEKRFLNGNFADWNALFNGTKTMSQMGFKPPALWQAYLDLGRFRNALLLDELKNHPTEGLKGFVDQFHLKGYDPKE